MPMGDICDDLAGKYPKDFQWTGWHPNDMCYCVSILKTEEEFWADDSENLTSENEVTDVPDAFKEWCIENEDRIEAARERGTEPYFVRDNKDYIDRALMPSEGDNEANIDKPLQEVKRTPQEIAEERHAARTQEDIDRIQSAWNTNRLNHLVELSERIGSYKDSEFSNLSSLLESENTSKEFDAFKNDFKLAKQYVESKIAEQTALTRKFMADPTNVGNMRELAKVLGVEQGEFMTFFEANELRGNPNYAKDLIYRINCQTAVVANELRRRGFNIEALGNTAGSWLEKLSQQTNAIWIDANGNIPQKTCIGATFTKYYERNGVNYGTWNKTTANRKQLIRALEGAITEDGRYHIDWAWNSQAKNLKGHIIMLEKVGDVIRYYDPQNGEVISNFYNYIADIKLSRGINLLRVDNLRIKPDYAAHILGKSGSKTVGGEIGKSGISGGITPKSDKAGFKVLQKQTKSNAEGYSKEIKYNKDLFYTHRLVINKDALNDLVGHAYTANELKAIDLN